MHLFTALTSILVLAAGVVDAAPAERSVCTSKNMKTRKEWRTLANSDKLSYINAVKCLMGKPPQLASVFPGSKSRYDDFVALHINSTNYVHWNAPFLPWHRWLLILWEQELKTSCGFQGTQPYWNLQLDNTIEGYPNSPLFDTTYGLGGNGPYLSDAEIAAENLPVLIPLPIPGRTGGGCLDNGPFANLSAHMGFGLSFDYNPRCVRRDFSPELVSIAASDAHFEAALDAPTYYDFNIAVQGHNLTVPGMTLHAAYHLGVGGQVGDNSDTYSSVGDPLFFFIHAGLDQLWNQWQRKCWPERKTDFSGPVAEWGFPFNYIGVDIPTANVTLDYQVEYVHFSDNVVVRDLMDIQGGKLCYQYV